MGYTTKFSGSINLSRALTIAEAKDLLDIHEEPNRAMLPAGVKVDGYMQWVPTEDMERIVWDGEEKFYSYTEWLCWLCEWLAERGIRANGELAWQGEETGDTGIIVVENSRVRATRGKHIKPSRAVPLTRRRLGEIALDQVTTGGAK